MEQIYRPGKKVRDADNQQKIVFHPAPRIPRDGEDAKRYNYAEHFGDTVKQQITVHERPLWGEPGIN
jgi:hypothetical protein